jgi:hypothetical protein
LVTDQSVKPQFNPWDFGLEGTLDVTVEKGPARIEGESDEQYLARVRGQKQQPMDADQEDPDGT